MQASDAYTVRTPMGTLFARFPEEDSPGPSVVWEGPQEAISYFAKSLLVCVGPTGAGIDMQSMEPSTLEGFCSPPGYGISVEPPEDDEGDFLNPGPLLATMDAALTPEQTLQLENARRDGFLRR